MNRSDIDKLQDKAHWRGLTPEEFNEVLQRIINYKGDDNLESLLSTLGYAGGSEDRELVEKYLIYPEDPMVSRSALSVLCDDWDLTPQYIDYVKTFVRGVKWDERREVRVMAMCIAGEYVRKAGDRECLECLIDVFINIHEDLTIRSIVFRCILRAIGEDWNEVQNIDPQSPFVKETIEKAYLLLNKLKKNFGK